MEIPAAIIVISFVKPAFVAPESGLFFVGMVIGSLGLSALGFAWRPLNDGP